MRLAIVDDVADVVLVSEYVGYEGASPWATRAGRYFLLIELPSYLHIGVTLKAPMEYPPDDG